MEIGIFENLFENRILKKLNLGNLDNQIFKKLNLGNLENCLKFVFWRLD